MEPRGKCLALGCSHCSVKKHTSKEEEKSSKRRRWGKKGVSNDDVNSCMMEEEFVIKQGHVAGTQIGIGEKVLVWGEDFIE